MTISIQTMNFIAVLQATILLFPIIARAGVHFNRNLGFSMGFRGRFRDMFSNLSVLGKKTCLNTPNVIRDMFGNVPKMSIELHPRPPERGVLRPWVHLRARLRLGHRQRRCQRGGLPATLSGQFNRLHSLLILWTGTRFNKKSFS